MLVPLFLTGIYASARDLGAIHNHKTIIKGYNINKKVVIGHPIEHWSLESKTYFG